MATTRHNIGAAWILIGTGAIDVQLTGSVVSDCRLYFGDAEPEQDTLDFATLSHGVYEYRGVANVYARASGSETSIIVSEEGGDASAANQVLQTELLTDIGAKTNSKGLYLEFIDIALAPVVPATDLAAWNTYFGFVDVFQRVEVGSNWVVLHGVGRNRLNAVFNTADDSNLLAFVDGDGFFTENTDDSFVITPNLHTIKLAEDFQINSSAIFLYQTAIRHFENSGVVFDSAGFFAGNAVGGNSALTSVVINAENINSSFMFISDAVVNANFYNLVEVVADNAKNIGNYFMPNINFSSNKASISLAGAVTIGSNFLQNSENISFLDISSCTYLGENSLDVIGQTMTVKIHPALLTNADYISFKLENTVTEIVVYPDEWAENQINDILSIVDSVNFNVLNTTSTVLECDNKTFVQLAISMTSCTTAPVIQFYGSTTIGGFKIGLPQTLVAGVVTIVSAADISLGGIFAKVVTAGTGVIGSALELKAWR